MRSILVIALSALAAVVAARENPFNVPSSGYNFMAGKPATISWNPTTGSTVTIKLQKGDDITPTSGIILATQIANSGTFSFTPLAGWGSGSDFTIEIIDDSNPRNINFTPKFGFSGATGSGLPSISITSSQSVSRSSSSSSTGSTSASSTMITSTTSSSSSSTTSSSSSSGSSSSSSSSSSASRSATVSASTSSRTAAPSQTEAVPNPNGATSFTLSAGLLSAVFGLMALL